MWTSRDTGDARQLVNKITEVVPGDAIASYAATLVTHIGIVADYAAPDPAVSRVGHSRISGWLVPVEWRRLRSAVRPKAVPSLRSLLTGRAGPLEPETASSDPNVRFTAVSPEVFALLREHSQGLVGRPSGVLTVEGYRDALEDAEQERVEGSKALSETEKSQLISARRGQGEFRRRVSVVERCCRLTGIESPRLLVASHIKPWHACETADERLDGNNGLLLAPHVDWLFDRGLISFKNCGQPLVSPFLSDADLRLLGLGNAVTMQTREFSTPQAHYLEFHRSAVFLS